LFQFGEEGFGEMAQSSRGCGFVGFEEVVEFLDAGLHCANRVGSAALVDGGGGHEFREFDQYFLLRLAAGVQKEGLDLQGVAGGE
jgi:hypothetical protein